MKNTFYLTLKALFFLKKVKFLSWLFVQEKRFDYKDQVKFKICDVITWEINNCNTYIAQYLKK